MYITHRQHLNVQNNSELAESIFDTRTCRRRAFAPTLFAASSPHYPYGMLLENVDLMCTCNRPPSGCEYLCVESTKPTVTNLNFKTSMSER